MSSKPELKGRAARLARLLPTGPGQAARTPFVLLVVLLLGGGLIGLLVLNSALSEGAFKLDDLQRETKNLTDEEQALQRDIDAYSAPDALQRRARELGMVPGGDPAFLDPDGRVKGVPSPAAAARQGSAPNPLLMAPEAMITATLPPPPSTPAAPSPARPAPAATPATSPTPTPTPAAPSPARPAPAATPTPATSPTPTPTPGR